MDRQERRKKIMSHGTDRIALITGRIQSLDSDPDSAPTPPPDRYPTPPSTKNQEQFFRDHPHHHHGEHVADSDQTKPKDQREVALRTSYNSRNIQKKPFSHFLGPITLKEVNTSIISSENTRAICSIIIAVLVVLSNVNVPHKVVKSTSLISYRPLYVVLLTDVLIVFGRLALYAQVAEEEENRENENGNNRNNNNSWEGAVKLLEMGLVLHQAIRAVFIDCSFYVVIVVCGLSLD